MAATQAQATLAIAADHPSFAGHFPGHPVLPAVVILAEAMAAIEAATGKPATAWMLSSAKFPAPVGPGARLCLHHEATAAGGMRFEMREGDAVVVVGLLLPS